MRARYLPQVLIAGAAAAVVALGPADAVASNLIVRGVAGQGGTTCTLVDGSRSSASMSVTCGNGNGRTLNAIYMNTSGTVHQGASAQAWIDAPPGISIDTISVNYCSNMNGGSGWGGGSFWGPSNQYGKQWSPATCSSNSTGQWSDYPEGVPRYGFQIVCGQTNCSGGYVYVPSFSLSATETAHPSLIAVGTGNIWYQGGKWLWNPPSDPWSATLIGSDATGICRYEWSMSGQTVGQSYPQNGTSWQQCPNNAAWNTSVDTAAYPNGPVSYQVEDWNAGNVATSDTETLNIDNQAPSVSMTPTPTASRASAVTFSVHAAAGPSGIAGLSCSDDGHPLTITAGSVSVPRNGTQRVECVVTNNAVDPQGQHNSGAAAVVVQSATSRIPLLSRRRAHGHVNVGVVIRWTWVGRQTVLRRVSIERLPRRGRVGFTCAGRGCPWHSREAPQQAVRELVRRLAGSRFRSGDVLTLTIAVPHRISERARLRIRNGRKPLVRRLS